MLNLVTRLNKKAEKKPKGKAFFQDQTRNKKAKIELFGLKKAKLPTLGRMPRKLQLTIFGRIAYFINGLKC